MDQYGILIVRTTSKNFPNGPKVYASLTNTGGEIRLNAPALSCTDRHGNNKEHPMLLVASFKPIKRLLWLVCCLKAIPIMHGHIARFRGKWLTRSGKGLSPNSQCESIPTVWMPPTNNDYSKILRAICDTSKSTLPIGENLPACGDVLEAQRDTGLGIQILGDKEDGFTPSGGIPQTGINDRFGVHGVSEILLANVNVRR